MHQQTLSIFVGKNVEVIRLMKTDGHEIDLRPSQTGGEAKLDQSSQWACRRATTNHGIAQAGETRVEVARATQNVAFTLGFYVRLVKEGSLGSSCLE